MPSLNEITANQAARLIDTPDAPVLVDPGLDEDFALDPAPLPGAFRHPHDDVVALLPRLGDARVVLLEAGLVLYDALYRRARDAVDERHDQPGTPVRDGAS